MNENQVGVWRTRFESERLAGLEDRSLRSRRRRWFGPRPAGVHPPNRRDGHREAVPPLAHRRRIATQPRRDLVMRAVPLRAGQHDAATQRERLRRRMAARPTLQHRALIGAQGDLDGRSSPACHGDPPMLVDNTGRTPTQPRKFPISQDFLTEQPCRTVEASFPIGSRSLSLRECSLGSSRVKCVEPATKRAHVGDELRGVVAAHVLTECEPAAGHRCSVSIGERQRRRPQVGAVGERPADPRCPPDPT